MRETYNVGVSVGAEIGVKETFFSGVVNTISVGLEVGYGFDVTQSMSQSINQSVSNSNIHTGAVCRRSVLDPYGMLMGSIYVTLFVYRVNRDGSVEGESITANIDPMDLEDLYE